MPGDIIWSEAAGEFIDLAMNASDVTRAFAKPSAPVPLAGRILVVDDDAGVRDILAHILRQAGYQVRCAEDGETGWDAFRSEGCDLLITDQAMPGLTGIGLLQRVRENCLEVPAILISGNVTCPEGELARWLTPGVTLAKPFSGAELLTAVRGILMHDVAGAGVRDGATVLQRP